jgi:signal transduction histidine kinase
MRTSKLQQLVILSLVALSTAMVAVLGGVGFARKLATFQPMGFELEANQGSWRVTEVEHPQIALEKGDRILLVQGQQVTSKDQIESLLRERPLSEILVNRGVDLETITYTRPRTAVNLTYIILTAIGIFYLLIGLFTVFKDSRSSALLFFCWCLTSAALYALSPPQTFGDSADRLVFLVDQLARSLLPALTLHLFLVCPSRLLGDRWLFRMLPLVYLPSAALLVFHADQMYGQPWIFGPPSASRLLAVDTFETLLLVLGGLLAALTLAFRFSRRPEWEERRQSQWLLFGMLGGYVPFLLLYALPRAFAFELPSWTQVIAVLPLALVPLAFAWAILKYRLLDLGSILRDAMAYSLTGLVGLFAFALVNLAIKSGVAAEFTLARNVLAFAAGITIAGVLTPTRGAISTGLERLRFGGSLAHRQLLTGLGQELLFERDLDALCDLLIDHLDDGLVSRSTLYLAQGGGMVPVQPAKELPRELAFDAFGADFWKRDVDSLSSVELPSGTASSGQRLFAAGYRYLFPLLVRGHRIGVAMLSYKYDEEPLNSEDIDLVRSLLNQASLAIENAQLLEEVHRKLREVTRLRDHNQGILESSPAGIVEIDAEERIISANHAFGAIVDLSRRLVIDQHLSTLLPMHFPEPGDDLFEVSYCEMSGQERHLQLSAASHQSAEGRRVLVIQDVSARVAMEIALQEKERLASLGMLAAGVAHEVNTPLTGISSYAQMLMQDIDENSPHHEILKKMERQTFRAAQIVNNLLEFSRSRHDELIPVPLPLLLNDCLDMLTDRAQEASVELKLEPLQGALKALGNEGELHQVFTNLIVNAIDAMAPLGGGRVSIAAQESDRRISVQVSDTGPGIGEERLETVFHPFFSSKVGQGGTGLGLAITYNIVRRHGGEVRVENHPDQPGCTFTVDLPRADSV